MLEQLSPLAKAVAERLKARGERIAVIDGATGGLISASLLTVPGALAFYVGGGVVYSERGRALLIGADPADLKGMKSVTEPYALLQARGVRDTFGADWGIAETGAVGGSRHPQGVEAGTSSIAVVGPGVERAMTWSTGRDDRIGNMEAFTRQALTFLDAVLGEAGTPAS